MWGIALVIVVFEKDLGSALVFFFVFLVMLYVATGKKFYLVIGLGLIAIGGIGAFMAFGHVQVRVNKKNALELTKMEWQVIREVGCGLSNKEIAGRLYLSEGTVRNYISSILRKLELRDRTQLAIWAVQNQNSQPEADV